MNPADREYFAGEIKRDLLAAESALMKARLTDTSGEKVIAMAALNGICTYLGQAIYRIRQADAMAAKYRERLEEDSDG